MNLDNYLSDFSIMLNALPTSDELIDNDVENIVEQLSYSLSQDELQIIEQDIAVECHSLASIYEDTRKYAIKHFREIALLSDLIPDININCEISNVRSREMSYNIMKQLSTKFDEFYFALKDSIASNAINNNELATMVIMLDNITDFIANSLAVYRHISNAIVRQFTE